MEQHPCRRKLDSYQGTEARIRDDVYVAVNGKNCIIKRGEWVKVRRKFALVIDQSEIQDLKTAEFLESQQKRFEEANAAF